MPFGLDSTGFTVKTLADIRASLETRAREVFGAGIDLDYDTVLGRVIGVTAGALDEVWQQLQNNYNARVPNNADGVLLDNIAAVRGMARNGATKATALVDIRGTIDTVVPINFEVGIGPDGPTFLQDAAVTLTEFGAGANVKPSAFVASTSSHTVTVNGTAYGPKTGATEQAVLDLLKTDIDAGEDVVCVRTGTGPAATLFIPGPLTSVAATLNVVVTALNGYVTEFTAREAGAVSGAAGAIDTIITTLGGVSSVNNRAAITPGYDAETDAELRIRMALAPSVLGINSVNAIFSRLSAIDEVQDVVVYENDSDVPDAQGRPAHSVHAIVYPDTVDALLIARVLWNSRAAGIQTHGATSADTEDSQGIAHTVSFDYAVELVVNVTVDLVTNDDFPDDGDEQVETAIAAAIGAVRMRDGAVRLFRLIGSIDEIEGIVDATITSPAANVTLAVGQKPVAGVITVNVT